MFSRRCIGPLARRRLVRGTIRDMAAGEIMLVDLACRVRGDTSQGAGALREGRCRGRVWRHADDVRGCAPAGTRRTACSRRCRHRGSGRLVIPFSIWRLATPLSICPLFDVCRRSVRALRTWAPQRATPTPSCYGATASPSRAAITRGPRTARADTISTSSGARASIYVDEDCINTAPMSCSHSTLLSVSPALLPTHRR